MIPSRFLHRLLLPLACASLAAIAPAQTVIGRLARLDGAQETPSVVTPARGLGFVTIDTVANTLAYREVFAGLGSAETLAHIHGFAAPGFAAPPLHTQALGALKCGVWTMTAAQVPSVLAGLAYFNVHSVVNPGGEIRGQIDIAPDQVTFCYGDGSGAACPCGNFSAPGDNEGCLHSGGAGARLQGYSGSTALNPSLSGDRLVLHTLRLPPSTFALFFQGTLQAAGGAGVVFGDGLRCIGGNQRRLALKQACNGQVGLPEPGDLPISISGGVGIPGVQYYQTWYRNPPGFCTTATFNLSNGLQVTWVP